MSIQLQYVQDLIAPNVCHVLCYELKNTDVLLHVSNPYCRFFILNYELVNHAERGAREEQREGRGIRVTYTVLNFKDL